MEITELNFNDYINLPYKPNGRARDGIDCYGLVRLVQKEQFGIDLPSFETDYSIDDNARLEELINQYKEGWVKVESPEAGDVVLFKVLGYEQHIGIAVSREAFLHVREGMDSVIEPFTTPRWNKRIVGYFKYVEKASANLTSIPHPLRTETYTTAIAEGSTISEVVQHIGKQYNVPDELKSNIYIAVNGIPVAQQFWDEYKIRKGDVVTYRTLPGKGAVRLLAVLAIAWVAPYLAGAAEFAYMGTAGATVAGSTLVYGATYAAVMVGGMALLDKIAPIRPPSEPTNPGSSERQLMVDGGQNQATPYGAIPVVLGKVRMTAQLGSKNYLSFENERDSYLSMLLYWGYGPLEITESTYKFGDVLVSNFDDKKIITLDRKTEPTTPVKAEFDAIYGKDVDQVTTNQELTCDGNPDTSVAPGTWTEASTDQAVDSVSVSLHFPQGLRKVKAQGGDAGSSYGTACMLRIERSSDGATWTLVEAFNASPTVTRVVDKLIGYESSEDYSLKPITESVTLVEPVAKKDAFTITKTYSRFGTTTLAGDAFKFIRVRRETGDNVEDNPDWRYYHAVVLHNVSFVTNVAPAIDPPNCKIAKTAIKIKASDQLNGSVEGFNAIVQTIAPVWNGTDWNTTAPTSNPASLMIHVLTHPANPRRKTLSNINLSEMGYFFDYCVTKGFEYNSVMGSQRSILDVLRDICAAGRASPALKDGKWSVTIDEPKSQIVQMFTPHNSWGFEGTKNLPDIPHGLRVQFFDQDNNYQEAEIIVYNIGYSESNASLFESITLPGVTKKSLVIDHARWHMAQAKLRPEIYSLNADLEYIVANRGDRVKVMHDVPMWGLGSGRIRERVSDTMLVLDEEIGIEAGKQYMLRFRSKTGSTTTRAVVNPGVDGYYTQVTLAASITQADADVLDLFMFGENQQEGQDLTVITVEPTGSSSARLTLVDYGVTDTYNIYTDYQTLTASTVFESQITLPGKIQFNAFGDKKPTITFCLSDESVMDVVSKGVFRYNINVAYTNASNLPSNTAQVQAEYDISATTDNTSRQVVSVDYIKGSVNIRDVVEGETYKIRLRYVSNDGRTSQWTEWFNHQVIGKTSQPGAVIGFVASADYATGKVKLQWGASPEPDIKGYEVRYDTNFGTDSGLVFDGDALACLADAPSSSGLTKTYYIAAYDYFGNYSSIVSTVDWLYPAMQNIGSVTASFEDTALTAATVTLDWVQPVTDFVVDYYEVEYSGIVKQVKADVITLPANWLGNRAFTLRVVDVNGNVSSGTTTNVTKLAPSSPSNYRSQVIDNTVMLFWTNPVKTTLPIDHTLVKKGATWNSAEVIGENKTEFASIDELKSGTFTYWIAAVDTDGNQSTPVSLTTQVAEPPDFEFFGEFAANFTTGTKVNAVVEAGAVVMPLKTTETWQQHFQTNSWTTPQNQIDAGYPIYAQPANSVASYYEEVFDYGTILSSSKITLNITGTSFGSPDIASSIAISSDGTTYTTYAGTSSVFATNFRYVKVRVTATANPTTELYRLTAINVALDAKKKNDSFTINALSTDTQGTIANFTKEFIDVQSITASAQGTTPLTVVRDFQDAVLSATYAISSNICTVAYNSHGFIAGQSIRLSFSSSTGVTGVYTITSSTTNTFSVALTASDSTGACLAYPQSCRVYVFNSSGTRVSTTVSLQITGY